MHSIAEVIECFMRFLRVLETYSCLGETRRQKSGFTLFMIVAVIVFQVHVVFLAGDSHNDSSFKLVGF